MKVKENMSFAKRAKQRDQNVFWIHRKLFVAVFSKFHQVNELPDGYALCYPQSLKWNSRLTEFISLYRKHYPTTSTELVPDPSRYQVWLHIRGEEGTKDFLEYMMTTKSSLLDRAFHMRTIRLCFRMLTSPIRMKPNFLIIGAARCGTSALYDYLRQHPCVAPAFTKEIYFFDQHFRKGMFWYRGFFPTILEKYYAKYIRKTDLITGEATPCYIFHPHVPKRVFKSNPKAKLIVLLRNPVDRAYSFYYHRIQFGLESLSFEDAIQKEEERLRGELEKMLKKDDYFSFNRQNYSYLSRGIYVDQLKNWMDLFPREQILILRSEDFFKDPSETFRQVTKFLNLPDWEPKNYRKINSVPYPKMNATTRKYLNDYFRPHMQRLYDLLGMKLDWEY